MIEAMERAGWRRVDAAADAAVILVNTCGFIRPAKEESINATLALIESVPDARVVMTGCLAQRYPHELAAEIPELAGVFGNRAPHRIPEFLAGLDDGARVMLPDPDPQSAPRRGHLLSLPGSAFVKVAEGCEHRCSFCAIPLIRGSLRSRPADQVVAEIRELLDRGLREINLVAQDLASYGRDLNRAAAGAARPQSGDLPGGARPVSSAVDLLERISALPGDFWVRLLYVYPERFPDAFLDLVAADSRLLPYFDIPFQHASAAVLRRMGRPGSAAGYLDLIARIRDRLPHAFIRSTVLVGFFGEDDAAFEELLQFQDAARIDWLGVFPYSPEDGTPALAGKPGRRVSAKEALRRANVVRERQEPITWSRVDRLVGRTLDVLVEEMVSGEPIALGRCYAQAPEVDGAVVVHVSEDDAGPSGEAASPAGRSAEPPHGSSDGGGIPGTSGRTGVPAGRDSVSPGRVVRCVITRRNGLDVEAVPL